MANSIKLKYGDTEVKIGVPVRYRLLEFQEPVHDLTESDFAQNILALLPPKPPEGEVAVVVADKTRLCGYKRILPWLLRSLQRSGVRDEQVTFYIAYGTHPPQSRDECIAAYGEVYNRYRFVHHDCTDEKRFVHLGETSRNTPVRIRRELRDADLIVTAGAISHHYFAGYGGGRKLIFPGLGEKEAIYANHRLYLDLKKKGLAAGCQPGKLVGNPLAEDLREIDELLPSYLSIHGLLDSKGDLASVHFGTSYADFLAVCSRLDECYRVAVPQRFSTVIASAGGYPKDINFIQTHKAIHNGAQLVRDGGTLIIFARCRDGVGSETFLPYLKLGGWDAAFRQLCREYVGNGGTALAMMEKTARIRICMVTELDPQVCRLIGVEKVDLEEVSRMVEATRDEVGVVTNSSLLVGELLNL